MLTQHAIVSSNKKVSKAHIIDTKNSDDAFVRRWEAALAVKKKLDETTLEEEKILERLPEHAKHGNIQVLLVLKYVGKDSNGEEKHEPVYVNTLEEIEAYYKRHRTMPPMGFGGDSPEERSEYFDAWYESRLAEYKEKETAVNEIQREFGLTAIREKICGFCAPSILSKGWICFRCADSQKNDQATRLLGKLDSIAKLLPDAKFPTNVSAKRCGIFQPD